MLSQTFRGSEAPQSVFSMESQNPLNRRPRQGPTAGSIDSQYAVPTKKQRGVFICETCDQSFTERRALNRHKKENKQHLARIGNLQPAKRFDCTECSHGFAREHDLKRHVSEVHRAKRRRNGMQGIATMFRHRSDDGSNATSIYEDTKMDFVFHGLDATSSQSSHTKDTDEDDVAPDVTTPSSRMSLSRRASMSVQQLLRRSTLQAPPPELQKAPEKQRHYSLATSMNELEDKPSLSRANSEPLLSADTTNEDMLDVWLNDNITHFFEQFDDAYKVLCGASNNKARAAQCPVCKVAHDDMSKLLACTAKHFEEPLRPHICTDCQFGFVHANHLELHQASVRTNHHCGFRFPHQCTGHHPKDEPNPTHQPGTHDSLHERMEAWYLLTLFFKARHLSAKLESQSPLDPSGRRWTLAALTRKYRNFSVASSLNVRTPTMPVVMEGAKHAHSWHLPAALEETLGRVAKRFRVLAMPGSMSHEYVHSQESPWTAAALMRA